MTLPPRQEKRVSMTVVLLEREAEPMIDPAEQKELYFGYGRSRTAPYTPLIDRVLVRIAALSAELVVLSLQKLCR
jgi:hypothetical protein